MGWGESALLGFSMEVFWISVKNNLADWLQRVI
jgi:hypothetical protein